MAYADFIDGVRADAERLGMRQSIYAFQGFPGCRYPLVRLRLDGSRYMLVTAGFHGDERAGPETLRRHLGEIVRGCKSRGLGLVVYPCVNPSGFEHSTRYNEEHQVNNNDFLRYLLPSGLLTDDLYGKPEPLAWVWASDLESTELPKETLALHKDLRRLEERGVLGRIVVAVDLHQDNFLDMPATYAYAFGDLRHYTRILEGIPKEIPVLANTRIGSGHGIALDSRGSIIAGDHEADVPAPTTNDDGLLTRHDGTINDLMFRLGVPYGVTVETTGSVPLERACEINLHWILSLLEMAAPRTLSLRPYRQTPGLCGPASLKIVAEHFGIACTERQLAALCKACPEAGTSAEGLLAAAHELGLRGEIRDESNFDALREIIDAGGAAIVDWFSFRGSEGGGHYSVVEGIDDDTILLQDPELGTLRSLKRTSFETLWFDFAELLPSRESFTLRRVLAFSRP
jgi:hypothetical protein